MDKTLKNKLRSMGITVGTGILLDRDKKYPVDQVLNGYIHTTTYGETYIIQEKYPISHIHGKVSLQPNINLNDLYKLIDLIPNWQELNLEDLVFIDTETTGLSWGNTTFPFLIGLGYFHGDSFVIMQILLRNQAEERSALMKLDEIISSHKMIISFNGKSFDIPLLKNRYDFQEISTTIHSLVHLDLLSLARKIWRYRLNDRSLYNLEHKILNVYRSNDDIPGWMVPEIYLNYLHTGDARPLFGITYHNRNDILSMVSLLNIIHAYIFDKKMDIEIEYLDKLAIARLCEASGNHNLALIKYQRCIDDRISEDDAGKIFSDMAMINKRHNKWKDAVHLWEQAAKKDDFTAMIQLAKYYEHKEKNILAAIYWTENAKLIFVNKPVELSTKIYKKIYIDLERRLNRLEIKKSKTSLH